jgi:hypothetical protein
LIDVAIVGLDLDLYRDGSGEGGKVVEDTEMGME